MYPFFLPGNAWMVDFFGRGNTSDDTFYSSCFFFSIMNILLLGIFMRCLVFFLALFPCPQMFMPLLAMHLTRKPSLRLRMVPCIVRERAARSMRLVEGHHTMRPAKL